MKKEKIFLLGATGLTGGEVLKQAVAVGHHVTAFVRSPEKLRKTNEQLTVVGGSPRNANELAAAMAGHDVVISTLGPRSRSDDQLIPECTKSYIEAMRRTGVRRVLAMSAALLFPGLGFPASLLQYYIRGALRGASQGEELLRQSDLSWTVVRPGRLTSGPLSQKYRVGMGVLPEKPRGISRADVAHWLLHELEMGQCVRSIVGLCR